MCKRWKVDATGLATPPRSKRKVQFSSAAQAVEWLTNAPRRCCTKHKLDDAASYLREETRTFRTQPDMPALRYAGAARMTTTEASHVLSQLVRDGRAYRTRAGRYRYRGVTD